MRNILIPAMSILNGTTLITLLIVSHGLLHGQLPQTSKADSDNDFRQTKWGMSKAQVVAAEGTPARDEPDRLMYMSEVLGSRVVAFFEFVDDKLAKAGYVLAEKYAEPNQYITVGATWVLALKEKYGEPKPQVEWLNDLYRSDRNKWGLAIAAGHLRIENSWETGRTEIQHVMTGSNFVVHVGVTYTSKELKAELEKKAKEAQKKAF